MKRAEFDKLFDEVFERVVKEQPLTPDPDASWNNIRDKVGVRGSRRFRPRRKYTAMAVIAAAVVLVFAGPAISEADHPFRALIKSIQQNTVSFMAGQTDERRDLAKTPPPPDDDSAYGISYQQTAKKLIYDTLEEAQDMLSFPPPAIRYIPGDYQLDNVSLYAFEGRKVDRAMLIYSRPEQEQPLTITFQKLNENEIFTSTSDQNAGRFSEVKVNGVTGLLLEGVDGIVHLDMALDNLVIMISGPLPKDEIIRIAESISP